MSVIEVDFPGNLAEVATVADLRALPSAFIANHAVYLVAATGLYAFDTSSLTADNGTTVIKPTDLTSLQAGRWLLCGSSIFDSGLRTALAAAGGSALVSLIQSGTGLSAFDLQTVLRPIAVHVHLFRELSDPDDTLAATRALATGYPVRYVAGKGSDTDGAYIQAQVEVPAGAVIFGDGVKSVIRDANGTGGTGPQDVYGIFSATSSAYNTFVDDIHISDLRMEGVVGAIGGHTVRNFQEWRHLINVRGVRNLLIERVTFFGTRGDGVCLSADVTTPVTFADYRHNHNVKIRDCIFDGDTADNRNCISVLDCTGLKIVGNKFINSTRSSMPGAIDLEPSPYALYVLRNVEILHNSFENCGGNIGTVSVQVPSAVSNLPVGLRIADNTFKDNTNTGADISIQMSRTFINTNVDQQIVITRNSGSGGARPFHLLSAKGVRIDESNVWEHYTNGAIIGFTGVTGKPYDCVVKPTLKDCGFAGLQVYRGDYLTLGGKYTDTATVAIFFDGVAAAGDGTTNVTIRDLTTRVGAGTMTAAIAKSADHSLSASTNRLMYETCDLNGLTVAFSATKPGQVLFGSATYDPSSLVDAAGVTTTVTVTGAALGDYAGASFSLDLQGITVTAWVSVADTVSVRFQNESGGTLDLASGTLRARVVKA